MGKGKDGKKRTVNIKLLSYKVKLKGSGYYINEDFSNETMTIKKELWVKLRSFDCKVYMLF